MKTIKLRGRVEMKQESLTGLEAVINVGPAEQCGYHESLRFVLRREEFDALKIGDFCSVTITAE